MGRGNDSVQASAAASLRGALIPNRFTLKKDIVEVPDDVASEEHRRREEAYARARLGRRDINLTFSAVCICGHRDEDHEHGEGACQTPMCRCQHARPGGSSFTDMNGNITVQSNLPEGGSSEEKELCIRGLNRHELCHEQFTDKLVFDAWVEEKKRMLKNGEEITATQMQRLWNILEDGMIEEREREANPGAFRFISALNRLNPRVGKTEALTEDVDVNAPDGYLPRDAHGNELQPGPDGKIHIPAGTVISTWGRYPLDPAQQMQSALLAESVPEYAAGELHPEVAKALEECRPHINKALSGNTADCLTAAKHIHKILRNYGFLREDLTEEERKQMEELAKQLGEMMPTMPEGSGSEGGSGGSGMPMPMNYPSNGGGQDDEGDQDGDEEGDGSGQGSGSSEGEDGDEEGQGSGSGQDEGDEQGNGSGGEDGEDGDEEGQGSGSGQDEGDEEGNGSGGEDGDEQDSSAGDSPNGKGQGSEGDKSSAGGQPGGGSQKSSGSEGKDGGSKNSPGGFGEGGGYRPDEPLPQAAREQNEREGKGRVSDEELEKRKREAAANQKRDRDNARERLSNNAAKRLGRFEGSSWSTPEGHKITSQRELRRRPGEEPAFADEQHEYARMGRELGGTLKRLKAQAIAGERFRRTGKLDSRRLVQAVNGEERVFKRRGINKVLDAEIDVDVDRSGSVTGDNGQNTNQFRMAEMFAWAGQEAGVPTSIYGWDGGHSHVRHYAYKEKHSESRDSIDSFFRTGGGGTPTAEGIEFARARLGKSRAKHRFLICVTDGQANDPQAARAQVEAARREGLIVLGMGFGVSSSIMDQQFGRGGWVSLQQYTEAPRIVGKMLTDLATRGGRAGRRR